MPKKKFSFGEVWNLDGFLSAILVGALLGGVASHRCQRIPLLIDMSKGSKILTGKVPCV